MITTKSQLLDIHLHLFCRASQTYKDGLNPIVLRITYRGQRREILTGLTCSKKDWQPSLTQVNDSSRGSTKTNKDLANIIHKVKEDFLELKYSGNDFTIDELIEKIRGKEAPPQTLMEYVNLKLQELKDRVGMDLAVTTYYKYKRVSRYLDDFLQDRRSVKNIAVARVDHEFLKQFFLYLRKEKKNEHNSSVALMNCLKTILKTPAKNGTIKNNPFDEFPLSQKPVFRDFLTADEIKKLQQLGNLTEAQANKRDLFLFACFTGLAYSDIKGLRGSDIVIDPDGSMCVMDPRQKTGVMSIIPLLSVAQEILKKHSLTEDCRDFKFYVPSNQKLNAGLKELAKKAEINKPLFMHLGRHTFATTVTLTNGVPLETVSKMLGHSTIKHTQIYAKIVASKVKADMKVIEGIF